MSETEATAAMQAAAAAAASDADQWTRTNCPTCTRSYKFYCPACNIPVGAPEGVSAPSLVLPLQVHIWFQDKIKKSTAPHAKVLAPQDVEIVPYPLSQEHAAALQYDRESTLVVYPTITSETMPEMTKDDLAKFKTLVFIDCPWQKAPVILQDEKLSNLRCVKLAKPPSESKFWRYHQAGPGCVSTIEAIQLMLQDFVDAANATDVPLREGASKTNLEDLLFFFKMLFSQIAERYEKDPRMNRKPPMDEAEKERQRLLRSQKELGKKRKLETKREQWSKISTALASGEISAIPRANDRCFNCKEPGHEAKQCPNPCRYCKQVGHFSGNCSMKRLRQEATTHEQQRITKAL